MTNVPTDRETETPTQQLVESRVRDLRTRPDTRLPQSRAGGQGLYLYLKSLDHLGRSSEVKNGENPKKVKCDGRIDRRTDRRTDRLTDKAGCIVA